MKNYIKTCNPLNFEFIYIVTDFILSKIFKWLSRFCCKLYDVVIVGCGFIGSTLAKFFSEKLKVTTMDVIPQPESLKDYGIPHKIVDIRNNELLKKELEVLK